MKFELLFDEIILLRIMRKFEIHNIYENICNINRYRKFENVSIFITLPRSDFIRLLLMDGLKLQNNEDV